MSIWMGLPLVSFILNIFAKIRFPFVFKQKNYFFMLLIIKIYLKPSNNGVSTSHIGKKKCPQLFADMRTNFTILFLNQNLHIYIICNMCAKSLIYSIFYSEIFYISLKLSFSSFQQNHHHQTQYDALFFADFKFY
jgi:hypothetical protein